MKRFLFPLSCVAAITSAVLACRDPSAGPLAPPEHAAHSTAPKFDGVYMVTKGDRRDLIRFVEGGKTLGLSVGNPGVLTNALYLLFNESDRCAKGSYELKDGLLRFTLRNKAGAVEYVGAIEGTKLGLKWRSEINGAIEEAEYAFEPVKTAYLLLGDAGTAGNPVAMGGPEAPSEPAAPSTPSPSPEPLAPGAALVPEGSGWVCFRVNGAPTQSVGSRCERKAAACESARKTAAGVYKDARVGKCGKQTSAFCFTVQRASGRGAASCSLSQADCDGERAGIAAEVDSTEVSVSTCARQ